MNAISCFRHIQLPTSHPLVLIPFLNRPQLSPYSQSSQVMNGTPHLTHRCLFMGGMVLLVLISPLLVQFRLPVLLTLTHLHPIIFHFYLPLLRLRHLLLAFLLPLLFPLAHSASDVQEINGYLSNGPSQITTDSPGNPHQLLSHQMTKILILMTPLTSFKLV